MHAISLDITYVRGTAIVASVTCFAYMCVGTARIAERFDTQSEHLCTDMYGITQ
jgi:hypothetical protein